MEETYDDIRICTTDCEDCPFIVECQIEKD